MPHPDLSANQVPFGSRTLTNERIGDTYFGTLHTANTPVSGDLIDVYDAYGNKTPIEIGSETVAVSGVRFDELFDLIFPVGSIELTHMDVNPSTYYIGTTWVRISEGLFLSDGLSGGEYTVQLSAENYPFHTHRPISDNGYNNFVMWHTEGAINRQEAANGSDNIYGFPSRRPYAYSLTSEPITAIDHHENCPPSYGLYVWERTS